MSTSDAEPSPLPSDFSQDCHHITHFYDDGNLILDVKGMLFQIHKSLLKRKSQTFRDMFSLSHVKGSTDDLVETITLHDDPHTFAKLLDVIYDGYSFFRNSGLRQCLEVLELAQKYEMVGIENMLYNYLEEKLPTSAKDPIHAYEKYQHYEEGPTLAPLVLHVGSLKLIPWAFYSFGVRFSYNFDPSKKETYNPPPEILSWLDGEAESARSMRPPVHSQEKAHTLAAHERANKLRRNTVIFYHLIEIQQIPWC